MTNKGVHMILSSCDVTQGGEGRGREAKCEKHARTRKKKHIQVN
jgi:hypothetical protein